MRPILILAVSLILGFAGLATAGVKGEEILALDLTAIPGGSIIFLKCSKGLDVKDCGIVSLWEQANPLPGLQSTVYSYANTPYQPDHKLLA